MKASIIYDATGLISVVICDVCNGTQTQGVYPNKKDCSKCKGRGYDDNHVLVGKRIDLKPPEPCTPARGFFGE